jgi:hypothetical protein
MRHLSRQLPPELGRERASHQCYALFQQVGVSWPLRKKGLHLLRALARDASGQPILVLGLTEDNWLGMLGNNINFDASDIGLLVNVVIFRARDARELKAKAVEIGIADRSLLEVPEATPDESRPWKPKSSARESEDEL